ncbi:hypothetical protein SAMN04487977_11075 [Treponema bryantii]|uniref:Uncharacterized protein n=1 Tax=Treponema bryantii TaxID=163 RepID=A0A1H9IR51_9SPIR|nr:hypothetical protein [Treponema bryantii]SEQ77060.1 hypothetical protein SAMN04487977_11075 [Treponema bryantii]
MSNSIVGNNGTPTQCLSWYETEIDEDEYEDMEGELVDEENVFGRRAIVPKNSNSNTVTVFFYYYAPTSEWYWNYNYGLNYKPVIPVVFAADANWNLTQCLNSYFSETSFTGQANGWKALNVTLTRKLVEGERIVFGVYSDLIGYASTGEIEDADTTMAYFYWTRAKRRDYSSQISYISSPEFISQQRNIFNDYEICLYLQYENEPDGFFYTRSVIGNVSVTGSFYGRSLGVKRALTNSTFFSDSSFRSLRKIIMKSEDIVFLDTVQKLLLILRNCFSTSEVNEEINKQSIFKRLFESSVENEEAVLRYGESFRSFEDSVTIDEVPLASRIFYRAVETVLSFWDWLRGKIREANNVVTLYCPISDEITLDCKI